MDPGNRTLVTHASLSVRSSMSPDIGALPIPGPYLTPELLAQQGTPGNSLNIRAPHSTLVHGHSGGLAMEHGSLELLEGEVSPFVGGGL